MNGNSFKTFIFVFFICLAILTASVRSFAQDDNSSDQQANEENAQQNALNQLQGMESKMKDESKKLDTLKQSIDREVTNDETPADTNTQVQENSAQAVVEKTVAVPGVVVQAAPEQVVPTQTTRGQSVPVPPIYVQMAPKPAVAVQPVYVQTAPEKTIPPAAPISIPPDQSASLPASSNTFKISGDVRAAMGIDSGGNAIFDRALADLNQRNYRILATGGLNNNINTYDPAIYSQVKVVMDASLAASVVSFHLNVTADPWSYTSKSPTMLVTGEGGDTARVQYLGWGATPYTISRIVDTLQNGDAFNLPEIKTKNGIVPATSLESTYTNIFNIPSAKMQYTFFPIREAWVDIKPTDEFKLRIFPMGYEDQAMTTNDPLRLSNSTEWWAESPWIDGWQQGNLNTGATPVSFNKGMWDKSLPFFTMDSPGQRLTALRGVSLAYKNDSENQTSLNAEIASPKTLWQNYGDYSTIPGSVRLQQFIGNQFYVGATGNMHLGYTTNEDLDAENFVEAADAGVRPLSWLKVNGEVASSKSIYDITSPGYETKYSGNAYYGAIEVASPTDQDMLRTDYYGMYPNEKTEDFFKSIIYFARMDDNFESSLSDYNGTSGDSFWGDDLTFYPSLYRYLPAISPGLSQDDLEPFSIGDGMDYGRTVVSWRADENWLEGKLQALEDIRHVTNNDDQDIENVYRIAATYHATDKLTTKALFLYNALPKTTAGVDPFLTVDDTADTSLQNLTVAGGKDPSLKTGALGARYQLTDWAAINGVWDYTNDTYLNTDDFPQGNLNGDYLTTYNQNGRIYEEVVPLLYDQSYFDQAPYPYHNIFKAGLEIDPTEEWHIYTDYTRNPNKFAGNIDDNMNHYGIETSYVPNPKIGFFARYTLSNGYDINRLVNDRELDFRYYNNFFFEIRMILPKDVRMSIQYGVGPAYNVQTSSTDPELAYYSTAVLETQHIVRIVFDKKF